MAQPLLQQPRRPPGQGDALGGGAALHIAEQDRRVACPVDAAGDQVVDAVGDDARVDPEQQQVGDHCVGVREQLGAGAQVPAAGAGHVDRQARVRADSLHR